jgi:hypothetical protein
MDILKSVRHTVAQVESNAFSLSFYRIHFPFQQYVIYERFVGPCFCILLFIKKKMEKEKRKNVSSLKRGVISVRFEGLELKKGKKNLSRIIIS